MAENYKRTGEQFRFVRGGGLNTLQQPDAMPADEYPMVVNGRWGENNSFQTRPGYTLLFQNSDASPITDVRAYARLSTDDKPRYLARAVNNKIWLDNGAQVGTLSGSGPARASIIPYRPNQSPNPWMYISTNQDYQKFSAPDAANLVTQQKVGLAEPQAPPDACPDAFNFFDFSAIANPPVAWAQGGTAAAPAFAARIVADTAVAIFLDPASGGNARYSVQVGSKEYEVGQTVQFVASGNRVVQDVLPPVNSGAVLTVASILYYSGTTGRCSVVVTQAANVFPSGALEGGPLGSLIDAALEANLRAAAPGLANELGVIQGAQPAPIFDDVALAGLRRGSLIQFSGGPEKVMVLSATAGSGSICFECITTGAHAVGETIQGLPAIIVSTIGAGDVGGAINATSFTSALTGAGTGTLTQAALAANPFNSLLAPSSNVAQQFDYLHFSVKADVLANIVQIVLTIDVGAAAPDYTTEAYYYTINASQILGFVPSNLTVFPTNRWTEVMFPINAMTRLGNDRTRSLLNAQAVRVSIQTTDSVNIALGSFWVGGGGQCDVGLSGSPLYYMLVPRSSTTGVTGNPSPQTRYGVSPRRQDVIVTLPATYADPQMDTWDIYRYGGTVPSFRYDGSVPIGTTSFTDIYFDNALNQAKAVDRDNYEPWPTIDLPFTATPGVSGGVTTTVAISGTMMVIIMQKATAFANPFPSGITNWLPGTVVLVGGKTAFHLWTRPTAFTVPAGPANYYAYLFQFAENAGAGVGLAAGAAGSTVNIIEPILANQHLPYIWGPNEKGDLFACGDPLRPGTFYYIKSYNPDSVPQKYNQELTNPAEPLLGGEVIDGVSLMASSKRWWALYPNFGSAQRYTPVERPVGRGLAAPFGHCTDGMNVYFVARDGIWMTSGGPGRSLTDKTLYNLFPHEGVPMGVNVARLGGTAYAPDYGRAGSFTLAYRNFFLYFDYQDSGGIPRTLVCDLRDPRRPAWSVDAYHDQIELHYAVEQQSGPVLTTAAGGASYEDLLLADTQGKIYQQVDKPGDNGVAFGAGIQTFEWNGADLRTREQWGDEWLDLVPFGIFGGVVVIPTSGGAAASGSTVVASGAVRVSTPISLAGGVLKNYVGLFVSWTDDPGGAGGPSVTTLFGWQPSWLEKPEEIVDRFGDWDNAGTPGAKYFQGFKLEADTFNAAKAIAIRDADALLTHAYNPSPVIHNGQQIIAYSFVTPFIAHLVRDEPAADGVEWRRFGIEWIAEPTPEQVRTWQTQATAHGLTGYMHIFQVTVAYAATAPVTLTITSYDGASPQAITLPATGGAYQKTTFLLSFNKGMLYSYQGVSAAPWQAFLNDWEILVGQWNRQGPYLNYQTIGGIRGDQAKI